MIKAYTRVRTCLLIAAAAATFLLQPHVASAQSSSSENPTQRDGSHDFDWMHGSWKVHLKRLQKPLTGSTTWIESEGTQTTRKIWDGRANIDEFVAVNAATNTKTEGLTLRLYNPKSRQWSIYWANANNGTLGLPPTVGRFHNGRGEFYDQEEWEGQSIIVRYTWSDITANSARFEQAFSPDGGKTWEPNWISTITRVKE